MDSGAEVVSDVLKAVRLSGAIFFEIEARAPWVAAAPPTQEIAADIMPGLRHVIEYHVVVEGEGWASRLNGDDGEPPVRLGPGSIVVFPHGDPHVLSSDPAMRAEPARGIQRLPGPDERLPYSFVLGGEGAERTRVVCGFLGLDAAPSNPLLAALPRCLHVEGGATGWLGQLIAATLQESREARLGGEGVLTRLSELIFIEVLRRYAEDLPPGATGFLAALKSREVGRALHLIHRDPAHPWTLAELARRCGASRTVLAERFTAHLGAAPMTYLQAWRMQLAEGMLAGGALPVAEIAARVGYESEAAFSRAFKRCTGATPAARRKGGR